MKLIFRKIMNVRKTLKYTKNGNHCYQKLDLYIQEILFICKHSIKGNGHKSNLREKEKYNMSPSLVPYLRDLDFCASLLFLKGTLFGCLKSRRVKVKLASQHFTQMLTLQSTYSNVVFPKPFPEPVSFGVHWDNNVMYGVWNGILSF